MTSEVLLFTLYFLDFRTEDVFITEQKNELQKEIETLNNNYETAEKDKIEALTRLQVLSNYFKEKETQLQE